jgi:hypothetical protein
MENMAAPIGNQNALGHDGGRPTKYKPEFAEQAYKLCLLGCTDKELGKFFEVEEKTINNWKNTNVEFLQSLKKGKEIADAEVTHKLYKRATGYATYEMTFEKIDSQMNFDENNAPNIITDAYKKKVVKKEVPPDTTAAIFWLKNRQPLKWRDKQITGFDVQQLADDELDSIINKLVRVANEQR